VVVKTVKADNHRLEVSFTERAETLLRQDFPVSMPVAGRISRIDLEVGDPVRKGELLARIDVIPTQQEIEALRAGVEMTTSRRELTADISVEQAELIQANKRVESILAETARIQPAIDAATTALSNAQTEQARVDRLIAAGALPGRDAEATRLATDQAESVLAARKAEAEILTARLAEARAGAASVQARLNKRLAEAKSQAAQVSEALARKSQADYTLQKSRVVSPIDGVVLARFERGPKELPAGAPLLSLGRLQDLEAECEVLSQDALRISRGTPVFLDAGVAFSEPIRGEVRLKEPLGFTKRSSLGVEQQRVRVRIGLIDPPRGLGAGYELWARFQLREKTTLSLPRSCFVRFGQEYRVWRVTGDKLELVTAEIGLKGNNYWELLGTTIEAGDLVVSKPSDELSPDLVVEVESEPTSDS